jgi:DNA-directed RNA polymerase subunit N (RpoN/RPB10)
MDKKKDKEKEKEKEKIQIEPIACDGLPIRCFTCGRVIAHLYNRYFELMNEKKSKMADDNSFQGEDNMDIIKKLGFNEKIYCCFKNLLAYPYGTYNYI